MKKYIALILALVLAVSCFAACEKEPENLAAVKFKEFAVGYGKADVSADPESHIGIVGSNDVATRRANSIKEPFWVNCVAFTDPDGTTVLVIAGDFAYSNNHIVKSLREGIEEKTGVPGTNIQYNVSHNHTGPDQGSTAEGACAKFCEMFIEKTIQAAVDALENRKPAQMYIGINRPENLNFQRHYIHTDGSYAGSGAECRPAELLTHLEKADNLMQVVKFVREGEKDILMVNWQAHPYQISDKRDVLSPGSPGVMRRVLLEKYGVESIYILGGAGDLVSKSYIGAENIAQNEDEHGTLLAESAIQAAENAVPAATGKIHYQEVDYVLPFPNEAKAWKLGAFGFGDFGYVSQPFEVFQTNAIAVRDASPYTMTFYAEVSNGNDLSGYTPDEEACAYGCYEQGPMFTPQGTAEVLEKKLKEMIQEVFDRSGQTKKEKLEGYLTDNSPKSDGVIYTNPTVGDKSAIIEAANGHYKVSLAAGVYSPPHVLIESKELAEEIISRSTMKLIFTQRMTVVGVEDP